jgi:hypothetical protein
MEIILPGRFLTQHLGSLVSKGRTAFVGAILEVVDSAKRLCGESPRKEYQKN